MANKVYGKVRSRDHHACRACGSRDIIEVHHIVFRSHGGGDTMDNLVSLCKLCHGLAHSLGDNYLAPWELQAIIWNSYSSIRDLRWSVRSHEGGLCASCDLSCTTCDFRTETWECLPHDHAVDNSFVCPDWRERDPAGLLTWNAARIHPKRLR